MPHRTTLALYGTSLIALPIILRQRFIYYILTAYVSFAFTVFFFAWSGLSYSLHVFREDLRIGILLFVLIPGTRTSLQYLASFGTLSFLLLSLHGQK